LFVLLVLHKKHIVYEKNIIKSKQFIIIKSDQKEYAFQKKPLTK